MYAAIWRALPGPWVVRLLVVLTLIAGAALLLVFHVYPWIMQTWFPTPDPALGAAARPATTLGPITLETASPAAEEPV